MALRDNEFYVFSDVYCLLPFPFFCVCLDLVCFFIYYTTISSESNCGSCICGWKEIRFQFAFIFVYFLTKELKKVNALESLFLCFDK